MKVDELVETRYSTTNGVATITLDRPTKLNAMTLRMVTELASILRHVRESDDIHVLVIKGSGRAFSSGYDIGLPDNDPPRVSDWRPLMTTGTEMTRAIMQLPKPVIAQVHGACFGGAFEMSLACDMTVCSDDALFGEAEVLFGDSSPFLILPWIVGRKTASETLLTGRSIGAEDALRYNIVNRVVTLPELESSVERLSRRLVAIPPASFAYTKNHLWRVYRTMGIEEAICSSLDLALLHLSDKNGPGAEFDARIRREGISATLAWQKKHYAKVPEW
jgi:enoyl-CoA hydratase/carnithine racemase